jgi:hypothetical protein
VSAVETRPPMPELKGVSWPDPRPGLARCRLAVDRAVGTATWTGDGSRTEQHEFRLGDGPGELAALIRVVHPRSFWEPDLSGRLLLVGSTGRVLARSRLLPQYAFEQMWPFSVLDASGLPVTEEWFDNIRLAQKAHPGAAPLWLFTAGYGWLLLASFTFTAVLFGLIALVVVLTGWSA